MCLCVQLSCVHNQNIAGLSSTMICGSDVVYSHITSGASAVSPPFPYFSPTPQVKAVLVNIFGGIVDCATIATGVTKAAKQVGLAIPLVVRVQGTNVEAAQRILQESGLPIGTAGSLAEAATKAVNSIAS